MKSLLIIRHAKSSWDFSGTEDFERPLNDRGKKDAPEMGQRLVVQKITIDKFISSPAKRAKKTAQLFIHQYQRSNDEIVFAPELYNAHVYIFSQIITSLDKSLNSVAIFAHNPGVTEFCNTLTSYRIDDMPTCGIFGIKIQSDSWQDLTTAHKDFWFFDYPKLKAEQ